MATAIQEVDLLNFLWKQEFTSDPSNNYMTSSMATDFLLQQQKCILQMLGGKSASHRHPSQRKQVYSMDLNKLDYITGQGPQKNDRTFNTIYTDITPTKPLHIIKNKMPAQSEAQQFNLHFIDNRTHLSLTASPFTKHTNKTSSDTASPIASVAYSIVAALSPFTYTSSAGSATPILSVATPASAVVTAGANNSTSDPFTPMTSVDIPGGIHISRLPTSKTDIVQRQEQHSHNTSQSTQPLPQFQFRIVEQKIRTAQAQHRHLYPPGAENDNPLTEGSLNLLDAYNKHREACKPVTEEPEKYKPTFKVGWHVQKWTDELENPDISYWRLDMVAGWVGVRKKGPSAVLGKLL